MTWDHVCVKGAFPKRLGWFDACGLLALAVPPRRVRKVHFLQAFAHRAFSVCGRIPDVQLVLVPLAIVGPVLKIVDHGDDAM